MSLSERIRENRCAVVGCQRERAEGFRFCADDVNADFRRELVQQPDGTFVRRRAIAARDLTGQLRAVA